MAGLMVIGLSASPAFAEEAFNGPHIGASVGWSGAKIGKGLDITANAGFDKQTNNGLVLGLEAEAGRTLSRTSASLAGPPVTNFTVRPSWNWSLSARAGVAATPNTLLYLRGGYTGTRVKVSATGAPAIAAVAAANIAGTKSAAFVGAGVEQKLSGASRFRLEYRRATNGRKDRIMAGMVFGF